VGIVSRRDGLRIIQQHGNAGEAGGGLQTRAKGGLSVGEIHGQSFAIRRASMASNWRNTVSPRILMAVARMRSESTLPAQRLRLMTSTKGLRPESTLRVVPSPMWVAIQPGTDPP